MARRRRTGNLPWRETWPIRASIDILAAIGALGLWLFVPAAPRITAPAHGEDAVLPLTILELNIPVQFAAPGVDG